MEQQVNPEIQNVFNNLQKELENEKMKRMTMETEMGQTSAFNQIKEPNLVEYQLDLKEELDRMFHLLSGHIISINDDGDEIWVEPEDDRLIIFSEYGVKQIMNVISFYLNRNTLMSFYDADTIIWKVRDFGIEINDLIYNRYEHFFSYPSPEDLYDKYLPVMKEKNKEISDETLKMTEEELYEKCMRWSKEELQSKIRHFPMIIVALVDTIHSTYLRALGGKERQSLRERLHISQTPTNVQDQMAMGHQPKFSLLNKSTW